MSAHQDQVDAKPEAPRPDLMETGDNVDAKFAGMHIGSSGAAVVSSSNVTDEDLRYRYRMDNARRGRFIIINNKNFRPETGMNERSGTDVDAANLYSDFKRLGFTCETHLNQTASQMLQLMIKAGSDNHSDCDCFGVAVLSHGDNSVLYGIDNIVNVDSFIQPIKDCRTLAGKPKIFIFQACRGNELDAGIEATDAESEPPKTNRIPLEADFLYAYSTVPGYFSWRNSSKGSWFVQGLHKMLEKYSFSDTVDFLKMLTRVNHEVAYEFESNAAQAHMTRKKQVPSVVSMLTKDLYFTDKRK